MTVRYNISRSNALLFVCALLCFHVLSLSAQHTGVVTGSVASAQGDTIAFASVALTDADGKILSFTICDGEGRFALREVSLGKYKLEIACVGYQHGHFDIEISQLNSEIGTFTLKEGEYLEGAIVTAQRPLITSKSDRLVYDISKDPAAAKSNVLEIINKIPFIEVDPNSDKIKVMGQKEGFSIVVNGKESLLISEANQYVAKVLQASKLKQIELITSPDGKYAGQKAVINIVTESNLPDGFASQIEAYGGTDLSWGASFDITSKINKLIYDISYSYSQYDDPFGVQSHNRLTNYGSDHKRYLDSRTETRTGRYGHNASVKTSYSVSKNDLLTAVFKYNNVKTAEIAVTEDIYKSINDTVSSNIKSELLHNDKSLKLSAGANYQRSFATRPGMLFTASYLLDIADNDNKYAFDTRDMLNCTTVTNDRFNTLNNREHTVFADFYNPFKDGQTYFITGKYIKRNYRSVLSEQSQLLCDENVFSLVSNYSLLNTRVMLTLQAGIEYTMFNSSFNNSQFGKQYFSFLPRIYFTYKPTPKSSFFLSLYKNVFRPDINYLNPYQIEVSPNHIIKGNPDLKNTKIYTAQLKFMYYFNNRIDIAFSGSYLYSPDYVQPMANIDDGAYIVTYKNIGSREIIGIDGFINYRPSLSAVFSLSGALKRQIYHYDQVTNAYWSPIVTLSARTALWKNSYLMGQLSYHELSNGAMENLAQQTKSHNNFSLFLFFTQNIGQHLKLSLDVQTPWVAREKLISETQSSEFYSYNETLRTGRIFKLRVIYNFGRFKESVQRNRRQVINTDRRLSD